MNYGTAYPHYPQSNWLMENKIIKCLLKRWWGSDSDPYLTLLNYRMTSVEYGLSSADILFNRKLKTGLSVLLEVNIRVSGTWRHAERQIRQTKNTQYDLRSQKLYENEAVHIHDGKPWLQAAQVSKHVTLYNSVCVTSLRCLLWRTGWCSSNPSRQEIHGNELVPQKKETPRDCNEQAVGQNRTRTIEINREKRIHGGLSAALMQPQSERGYCAVACLHFSGNGYTSCQESRAQLPSGAPSIYH